MDACAPRMPALPGRLRSQGDCAPRNVLTTRCGADFPGLILFDESLALFDRQEFVSIHVRYLVNHAARPANFNEVYFHPLLQAEVQPKVVLRYITPAASRFANLR